MIGTQAASISPAAFQAKAVAAVAARAQAQAAALPPLQSDAALPEKLATLMELVQKQTEERRNELEVAVEANGGKIPAAGKGGKASKGKKSKQSSTERAVLDAQAKLAALAAATATITAAGQLHAAIQQREGAWTAAAAQREPLVTAALTRAYGAGSALSKAQDAEAKVWAGVLQAQTALTTVGAEKKAAQARLKVLIPKAFKNLLPPVAIKKLVKAKPVAVLLASGGIYMAANMAVSKIMDVVAPAMMGADKALMGARMAYFQVALKEGKESKNAKKMMKAVKKAEKILKKIKLPIKMAEKKLNKLQQVQESAKELLVLKVKGGAVAFGIKFALKKYKLAVAGTLPPNLKLLEKSSAKSSDGKSSGGKSSGNKSSGKKSAGSKGKSGKKVKSTSPPSPLEQANAAALAAKAAVVTADFKAEDAERMVSHQLMEGLNGPLTTCFLLKKK